MAFLRSFGPLGFEIHIFCCNTLCLVYLAWQRARQPISATRDFSVQKPEVSGRISSDPSRSVVTWTLATKTRRRKLGVPDRYFGFTAVALNTVLTVPPGNHAAAPAGTDAV